MDYKLVVVVVVVAAAVAVIFGGSGLLLRLPTSIDDLGKNWPLLCCFILVSLVMRSLLGFRV